MSLNKSFCCFFSLSLSLVFSPKTYAEYITYDHFFEGLLYGQESFASGPFSGRFSYVYPQELNLEYESWSGGMPVSGRGFISAFEIKIGSQKWNSENVEFSLQNGPGLIFWNGEWWGGSDDSFNFSAGGFSLNNNQNISFLISFSDTTGTLFSDISLLNRPMALNDFTSATLDINWSYWPHGFPPDYETHGTAADGQFKGASGILTSLIPEPSSLSLLLAGGLVALAGRKKA